MALSLPKLGECLEVGLLGTPNHRLSVTWVRGWEGVEPRIVSEGEDDDLFLTSNLIEEVLPLIEMQRRLCILHAHEELVGVRQAPAAGGADANGQLPLPARELRGHLAMTRERLLQVPKTLNSKVEDALGP